MRSKTLGLIALVTTFASTASFADTDKPTYKGSTVAMTAHAKGYPTGRTGSSEPGAAGTPVGPSTGVARAGTTDPASPAN